MSQGWVDEVGLWLCHVLDGKFWASYFTSFLLAFSLVTGTKGGNRGRNQTYFSGFLCRLHKAWSPEFGTCRGSVNDRLFHSSSFNLPCQDVSLFSFPGLFLWVVGAGRRCGVDLATSAGAQPSLRTLREVPGQDLGARQLQTGISSPARDKMGGGRDEDKGGDQRSPGARRIPWEGGSPAPLRVLLLQAQISTPAASAAL